MFKAGVVGLSILGVAVVALWRPGESGDSLVPLSDYNSSGSAVPGSSRNINMHDDRSAASLEQPTPIPTTTATPTSTRLVGAASAPPETGSESKTFDDVPPSSTQVLPALGESRLSNASEGTTEELKQLSADNVQAAFETITPLCYPVAKCATSIEVIKRILTEPKDERDSWAYGMEYELNQRLDHLPPAAVAMGNRPMYRQVNCNAHGCLVYRTRPIAPSLDYGKQLADEIRGDPTITGLNKNGTWPTQHGLFQGGGPGKEFEIMLFLR